MPIWLPENYGSGRKRYPPDVIDRWLNSGRSTNTVRPPRPPRRNVVPGVTGPGGVGGAMPAPADPYADLWGTADARVRANTNPLLELLYKRQAEEEARARATAEMWSKGIVDIIGSHRGPLEAAYNQAVEQAKGLETAVSNRLSETGGEAAEGFRQKLAQINAPSDAPADELGQTYQGAAGAGFASGSADIQPLITRGSEERAWLEKQGVLAQQQTTDELFNMLNDIYGRYGGQIEEITAGIPGQIQDMYDTLFSQKKTEESQSMEQLMRERELAIQQRQWEREFNQKAQLAAMAANNKKELARLKAEEAARERAFRAEQAAYDRQLKARGQDISSATKLATDNPPAKRTQIVTRPDGSKVLVDMDTGLPIRTVSPPGGKGGGKPVTGAQSAVTVNEGVTQILDPQGRIKGRYKDSAKPDAAIYQAVESVLSARKIPASERARIRKLIYQRIVTADPDYQIPKWVSNTWNKKQPKKGQ